MDLGIVYCPHCDTPFIGTANLKRHMKSCKRKMCEKCERKETCNCSWFRDPYYYIVSCDKSKENERK